MADAKPSTGAADVTIYVTATVARVFRLAGTLKPYQRWPEPGKLGRVYTVSIIEARRVLEAAEQARDKINRSDAAKRRGLSCFVGNVRETLAKSEAEAAFGRFMAHATTAGAALIKSAAP